MIRQNLEVMSTQTTTTDNTSFIKKGEKFEIEFSDVSPCAYVRLMEKDKESPWKYKATLTELLWVIGKGETLSFENIWLKDSLKNKVFRLYRWKPENALNEIDPHWTLSDSFTNDDPRES